MCAGGLLVDQEHNNEELVVTALVGHCLPVGGMYGLCEKCANVVSAEYEEHPHQI